MCHIKIINNMLLKAIFRNISKILMKVTVKCVKDICLKHQNSELPAKCHDHHKRLPEIYIFYIY
jgi:hypothetical protein